MDTLNSRQSESTISVVIPTFNREHFISNCVQSVFCQTKKPDEIIIVDDGSIDNTWKILKELGFSDSKNSQKPYRYIHQNNKGVSSARNVAIKASKYEYLAFLDSDDLWQTNKLEKQMFALKKEKIRYRLSHTDEIWIRNGIRVNARKKHAKSGGNIFLKCLKLCCISPSSAVVHRSVFDDFGYFDENLPACEDYDFWLRYCTYEKVHYLNEPLSIKNGGLHNQLSKSHWGLDRFRIYALEKLLQDKKVDKFKRRQILKEIIARVEILINGSVKRCNDVFTQQLRIKKTHWKAQLENETIHK